MFAQDNEDELYILPFLEDKIGIFLDIGAADGITYSNTHALYKKGWKGMCVEPHPDNYNKLYNLYKNSHIKTINKAIGNGEEIPFWTTGDTLISTGVKRVKEDWERSNNIKWIETRVPTITIPDLLKGITYLDFISIDCEEMDYEILKQFNNDFLGAQLLVVEHNHNVERFNDLLKRNYVRKTRLNLYYEL